MTQNSTPVDRRTVVQSCGAILASTLAGCSFLSGDQGPDSNGNNSSNGGSKNSSVKNAIQSVDANGSSILIELKEHDSISQVKVIDPSGATWQTEDLGGGQAAFNLFSNGSYATGEYTLQVLDQEQNVIEEDSTHNLSPDIEIVESGIALNHPEKGWDKEDTGWFGDGFITVKNNGSGPAFVHGIVFENAPGEVDIKERFSNPNKIVKPGEEVTFKSSTLPFSTGNPPRPECGETLSISGRVVTEHGDVEQKYTAPSTFNETKRDPEYRENINRPPNPNGTDYTGFACEKELVSED